ncbi:MAG TPA: site-2 protease family protein [Candidatus Saccharimonadales bacterium]|jgi:Zn-dependent protease|nr:site-2 protease family protein [Candidatus Saccharimonadales bacterium]
MLGNLSGGDLLIVLVSLIFSLSLHEAMHGFAAHWLGDPTAEEAGRLTLNPLKHIDLVTTIILPIIMIVTTGIPFFAAKPVPFNPDRVKYDEFGTAIVGLAGPLTNLALAGLAAGIFHLAGADLNSFFYHVLILFTEVNVGFFVFNMIPFPPLDGSRLLYAFAPEPLQELMMRIESMGFLAILVFIFVIFQFISGPIISIENSLISFLLS